MQTTIKIKLTKADNAKYFNANVGDVVEVEFEGFYLKGCVAQEIGNPHINAAKAQAVAARTHAFNAFRNGLQITDDSVHMTNGVAQAFTAQKAVNKNYANAHAGVDATKGEILFYQGKPLPACHFSDSNGGKTVDNKYAWENAKDDPWDAAAGTGRTGHGQGLSQRGAKYAASIGVDYKEILSFYYEGTTVVGDYGAKKPEPEKEEPILLDPQKVINIALAEVGYVEKKSAKDLDDKTANAGALNYTKYSRDLNAIPDYYNGGKQGAAWCDVFVDWCFYKAYGYPTGRTMIYQPTKSTGAGCKYSRGFYKAKKQLFDIPQIGDQIFFWPKDRSDPNAVQHTGLVYNFDTKKVYTVEGNASNKVQKKSYALSDPTIAGYGRPNWNEKPSSTVPTQPTMPTTPVEDTTPTLKRNAQGNYVKILQTRLNVHGHPGRTSNLSVDGKFGPLTEACLKAFQTAKKLKSDGICNDATWAELLKSPPAPVYKYTVTITGLSEAQKVEMLAKWSTAKAVLEN